MEYNFGRGQEKKGSSFPGRFLSSEASQSNLMMIGWCAVLSKRLPMKPRTRIPDTCNSLEWKRSAKSKKFLSLLTRFTASVYTTVSTGTVSLRLPVSPSTRSPSTRSVFFSLRVQQSWLFIKTRNHHHNNIDRFAFFSLTDKNNWVISYDRLVTCIELLLPLWSGCPSANSVVWLQEWALQLKLENPLPGLSGSLPSW